ncbi:MAG: AsmA family protein, partial [Dongiaceae bacterium]
MRRAIMAILLAVTGLIVLLVVGAVVAFYTVDLRSFAEKRISDSLDRRVSIGSLQIGWGNPLKVELRNLQLANAPWGSTPNMVEVESLSAEIDTKALLSRQVRYRK